MSRIVRERVDARIGAANPSREEVDRKREAVHLGEQRDDEGRKGAERTPVAARLRLREAEGENDKHCGVDDHPPPEAIGGHSLMRHGLPSPPSSGFGPGPWPCAP